MATRWDAGRYHQISGPMEEMGLAVLERLDLRGDETVLDAGCGSGRVTTHLVERLPRGRVLAVDLSEGMIEEARRTLGDRADVRHADLLELELEEQVDVVFSTATFHWIPDHDRLFVRLFDALRPGGRLVAQCGGYGNIAGVLAAAAEVAGRPAFATSFHGWSRGSYFATAEDTETRLERTGFDEISCWLAANPIQPDDPAGYLQTIVLRDHLSRLPAELERPFVEQVLELLDELAAFDYVRPNIDARRPA